MLKARAPKMPAPVLDGLRARYKHWRREIDCRYITYRVDGINVRGFYVRPLATSDERLPVVVFNRSGNADTGELPFQYVIGKLFPLVEQGYVVIGTFYRGASRNGSPSEYRLEDEFGGEDVNDVLALLPIIDSMEFADPERIGLWGESRGGMMAYLAARRSSRFDTLVTESTPTDLEMELRVRPEMENVFRTWIPGYDEQRARALEARSALRWAEELPDVPILILHGSDDQRVSAESALKMALRLQELSHPYSLIIYEGGSHSLGKHESEVRDQVIEWFDEKLAKKSDNRNDGEHSPGVAGTPRSANEKRGK